MDSQSEFVLNKEQKQFLLKLARDTAQAELDGRKLPEVSKEAKALGLDRKCGGCFVTFHNHGDLRGCIGCFTPTDALYEVVQSRAVASTQDHRFSFNRVTPDEFKNKIDVEISILSPPKPIKDPLKEVEVGKHGIIVSKGYYRGTYLPQVATEQGWNVKTFVTHCANRKAGIPGDVLNDPDVHWETYTATILREKEEH